MAVRHFRMKLPPGCEWEEERAAGEPRCAEQPDFLHERGLQRKTRFKLAILYYKAWEIATATAADARFFGCWGIGCGRFAEGG
jgi:hypothetical protein